MSLHIVGTGTYNSDTENVPQIAFGTGGFGGQFTGLSNFLWGSGARGAIVLDGVNTFTWATLAANVYTLLVANGNLHCSSLQIDSGVTLKPVGMALFCSGNLTLNGIIDANGSNGVGTSGGAAGAGTYMQGGGQGGAGKAGGGNGGSASALAAGMGGVSGSGGSAGAFIGGVGNFTPVLEIAGGVNGGYTFTTVMMQGRILATGSTQAIGGGGGGGGGASAALGDAGGGGGGGGGCILLFAKTISGSGTIRSNGGRGANATGVNAGGGAAGAGGFVGVITTSVTFTSTVTVTALLATGGNGIGTGASGSTSNAGNTCYYYFA